MGDRIRAIGQPATAGEFRRQDGKRLMRINCSDNESRRGLPPSLWMMHRAELIAALATAVPTNTVGFGRALLRVEQDDETVTAHFSDGTSERADLLVGADGIRSAVRASVWGQQPTRYAGYTCWRGVANVPEAVHPRGLLMEIWGAGKRFGVTPLPGGRAYWFAVSDEPEGAVDVDAKAALMDRFATWASPVPELLDLTPSGTIIRNDIVDRPPAKPWSDKRIVIIGDAAHPTTPNLGQGGCMAIEDAVVLARCLTSAASVGAALNAFERERYQRTAAVTTESWLFGRLAQGSAPLTRFVRDWGTRLTPSRIAFAQLSRFPQFDTGPIAAAANLTGRSADSLAS